jgi:hypothetical protein
LNFIQDLPCNHLLRNSIEGLWGKLDIDLATPSARKLGSHDPKKPQYLCPLDLFDSLAGKTFQTVYDCFYLAKSLTVATGGLQQKKQAVVDLHVHTAHRPKIEQPGGPKAERSDFVP